MARWIALIEFANFDDEATEAEVRGQLAATFDVAWSDPKNPGKQKPGTPKVVKIQAKRQLSRDPD